jgi:SM-20-related protein
MIHPIQELPRQTLSLIASLKSEAEQIDGKAAGTGREAGHSLNTGIRQNRIAWLDGSTPAQSEFLNRAEELRMRMNEQFFFGLFEFEAQFGITDPGGFYKRHLDSFAGARNRIVSLVTYLNPSWNHGHGGELLIWRQPEDRGPPSAIVWPEAGMSVFMLSEDIPHEVRAASAARYAIAGWWSVNRGSPG